MPRGRNQEAFLIILDLGSCHSADFFENAKLCITRMIQRRLFTKSYDEIGLLLVGSTKTENPLDYHNISVGFPLTVSSWKMISFINGLCEKDIGPEGDWLQGVVVGMQILKDELSKEFAKTTFVLITDCSSEEYDQDDIPVKIIIENLCSMGVAVVALGLPEEFEPKDVKQTSTGGETKSEVSRNVLNDIIQNVDDGTICDFDSAVHHLSSLQNKRVTPTPWKVTLNIGPDIHLPLSGYRKISEDQFPTWDKVIENDTSARPCQETAYFLRLDEESETENAGKPIDPDDVIYSYMFGDTIVPVDDDNEKAMDYYAAEKCLSVICFTASHNVPQHILTGNGVLYFTLQSGRNEAGTAFSAFVQAMDDSKTVAIVRRVYQKGYSPCVGVLFPKYKKGIEFLVYAELPFAEDVRDDVVFPPLKQEIEHLISSQLDVVDNLINSMNLMCSSEDKTESFNPKEVPNIGHHHRYVCISHRILNTDTKELPVFNETKEISNPFTNSSLVDEHLTALQNLFELKKVEPRRPKKEASGFQQLHLEKDKQDNDKLNLPSTSANERTVMNRPCDSNFFVGTTNPVVDFITLLEKEVDFSIAFQLMQKTIEKLVERCFEASEYKKPLGALKALRKTCIQHDPSLYNRWIPQFKDWLKMLSKITFWELIVSDKLGLISSVETDKSLVSTAEAENFLDTGTQAIAINGNAAGNDEEDDDLLDQL